MCKVPCDGDVITTDGGSGAWSQVIVVNDACSTLFISIACICMAYSPVPVDERSSKLYSVVLVAVRSITPLVHSDVY